jgi:diguanylate cyclase (GGDEF)-like protein
MIPQHDPLRSLKEIIQVQEAQISDHNLLGQIIAELLGSRSSPEAYQILSRSAPLLFPEIQGALFLRSGPARESVFERVVAWGGFKQRKRMFTQGECRALYFCRPHHVEPSQGNGTVCHHVALAQHGSYSCLPLMVDGSALGVLHLQSEGDALTPWKRQLAEELAKYCALVLDNLRLRELLSIKAVRDRLTGLFNYDHMEETLRRELAVRSPRPIGIIMIDIDHFKRFNTEFTHEGGNALLRAFGDFLQKQVRPGDVACRYGGEEFMLILPGASQEVVEHRAERIRQEVKHLEVTHRAQPLGRITLSLGVAMSGLGVQTEEVLAMASSALQQAKKEGRDRVVVAPCCQHEGCPRLGA